jgi:hypothetical protein
MSLTPLDIPPGIIKEDSAYASRNRYVDGNNVRFFKRFPEKIGGYVELSESSADLADPARGAHVWRTLDGTAYFAFGTRRKLWLYDDNDTLYDITPIRESGQLTDPFDTVDTDETVTVNDTGHGTAVGDTVIFDNATAVGGITIDGAYVVTTVPGANSYTIEHSSAATSTVSGGGGTVDYEYEITIGLDESTETVETLAWGEGTWDEGPWGGSVPTLAGTLAFRIWTLDNWGEDLVATYWGGAMYHWDASAGTSTRAAAISNSPSVVNGLYVSQDTRHIVALGAHDGSAQDPLLTAWADQETLTTWTASATNTAGDKLIESGNDIVGSISTRFGRLIVTDFSAHIMTFTGPPFTFGIRKVGERCGMLSPHAGVTFNDLAFWMGRGRFFMFDGAVREIECDLQDEVFDNLNLVQAFKVASGTVVDKHEVWWFYPTLSDLQNTKAIIYNVKDRIWYPSDFARSAWLDKNVFTAKPVAVDNSGMMFLQESGSDANGSALSYYLQSGDMELGNGDQSMHVRRLINDFQRLTGNHTLTLIAKTDPNASSVTKGPYSFGESTSQISARAKGRSIAFKIASDELDSDFRAGLWRADISPHGRR